MARKRYTEEQIFGVLQEGKSGTKVPELCPKYGISEATYYNWKTKYAGMTVSELRRLKTLEAETSSVNQPQPSILADILAVSLMQSN